MAKQHLREAYNHIKEDSPKNALKVRGAIVAATLDIPAQPYRHPVDKYKVNNDGNSFRAWKQFQGI